ncbi:MAG TPA: RDD family protein [Rhizomicrobium sp.]|nr:RDD family protein [Rhizomicrobium sp.]
MNTANPYAPPQATVQDVADSATTPAGRGTRLVGAILDTIIFAAMVYIPLIIGIGMNGRPMVVNGHFNPMVIAGSGTWLRNGQSIAKKMLGIKVVRSDGSRASLGRIFLLRNVVNTVLAVVPFYGLVDALLIFGEARQCVHDKIADTIVIKA